ncbi:MAG: hypothetical protein J0L92_02140, partial [Deltaproteobacteria bacterium]|nr:hypothetical protein [Deltaproteobacteria bacterium]
ARAAAPAPPPVLATVVEGVLAWAPTTGIEGMAASALVATQNLDGTPPTPPNTAPTPPNTATPVVPTPPSRTNAPAADVTPPGTCGRCTAARTDGTLASLLGLALALVLAARRANPRA